jgi:hypothetical protein
MKRTDPKASGLSAQGVDPIAHFTRRFIRKGDGDDFVGWEITLLNQIGNFLGDDAGFAAPCAG